METKAEFGFKIPTWALCYIVNNDYSGITEEDKEMVDKFWNKWQKKADMYECVVVFSAPEDIDAEKYFYPSPEFGLACDVVDCTLTFLQ